MFNGVIHKCSTRAVISCIDCFGGIAGSLSPPSLVSNSTILPGSYLETILTESEAEIHNGLIAGVSNKDNVVLGFSNLSKVDLPQPEGPRRTTNSPLWMSRETPSMIVVLP